ncbi:hypothetical protein OA2633_05596 [Oceanicaulis sp. HTCC2633]|jgi:hypothetical protein|nr:hypothetical protein OA2633_05596 [Oceanicaulis sp. HTCC2633]
MMSEDPTRLNIERAREALARARLDDVAMAVRAPRPADLSRLEETQARAENLSARADAFRDTVRSRMGLSAYTGGAASFTSGLSGMDAALCDADVCAPAPPAMTDASRAALMGEVERAPAVAQPSVADNARESRSAEPREPRRRRFFWLF